MQMQRKTMAVMLAATLATSIAGPVIAQDFVFNWNPRSGDVWVDTWLSDINRYGYRNRDPFVDEMVRYYGAPRDLVLDLLVDRRWAPGDVYYACALAQIIGRPCRYVVDEWERGHGQGWGVIAKRLGIKPGSAQFHRLKRGFVPSYDRWSRVIRIDEDLYRDYPERARAIRLGHDEHGNDRDAGRKAGHGKPDHANKDDRGHGHGKNKHKGNNGKGNDKGGRR